MSSMLTDRWQESDITLESEFPESLQTEVARNFREVQRIANVASRHIWCLEDLHHVDVASIWYEWFEHVSKAESHQVFLSSHPEQIFRMKTLYHVTSAQALDSVCSGIPLMPSVLQPKNDVVSHRGFGLSAVDLLIEACGFETEAKGLFLWLGAKVDNEQFTYEDLIAKMGSKVDEELFDLLFEKPRRAGDFPHEINKTLQHVCNLLMAGKKPGDIPELKVYVENFMQKLFGPTGVREGWYLAMKEAFLGNYIESENKSFDILQHFLPQLLRNYLDTLERKKQKAKQECSSPQAIILQVDAWEMFNGRCAQRPYAFLPGRDPDEIVPTSSLGLETVKVIYLENPNGLSSLVQQVLKKRGIEIKTLNDLPKSALLDQEKPVKIEESKINPEEPLCERRYRGDRQKKWRERFQQGLMAPCFTTPVTDNVVDFWFTVFGRELFSSRITKENEHTYKWFLSREFSRNRIRGLVY